jgi:hypothetical protein
LQKGFAAGADHQRFRILRFFGGKFFGHGCGQSLRCFETTPPRSVRSFEIGITKLADRCGTIQFPSGPKVAAFETAEDRRSADLGPFALKGIKDFFDGVGHKNPESRVLESEFRSQSFIFFLDSKIQWLLLPHLSCLG